MESFMLKLKDFFKGGKGKDKTSKIILIVGLAGILLIFLSGQIGKPKTAAKEESVSPSETTEDYIKQTEERLGKIVSSIQGAGDAEVMVMAETGTQYIYAQEEKNKSTATTGSEKNDSAQENQKQPVILKENDGGNKALVVTEIKPKIQGVIVVCEGGADPKVKEDIIGAIKTLLNISGKSIYVTSN